MPALEPHLSAPTAEREPLSGVDPARVASLLSGFAETLARTERELDEPGFEELCRAVEGDLDATEEALWAERIARSPELAARAEDLARFRAECERPASNLLEFRRKPSRVAWSGWLAAAALLLFAVSLRENPALVEAPAPATASVPHQLDWSDDQLFVDGFEAGDASSWSTVAPAG